MVLCGWAPPNMPAWVQPLLLAGELALSAALLVQIVLYSHASRHWIRTIWDGMENIGLSAMQSVSFPIALLEENGVVFGIMQHLRHSCIRIIRYSAVRFSSIFV